MSTQSYPALCSINCTLYLFMNNFNSGKQIQFVCYEMKQTSFKHIKTMLKQPDFPITLQISQY